MNRNIIVCLIGCICLSSSLSSYAKKKIDPDAYKAAEEEARKREKEREQYREKLTDEEKEAQKKKEDAEKEKERQRKAELEAQKRKEEQERAAKLAESVQGIKCNNNLILQTLELNEKTVGFNPSPFEKGRIHTALIGMLEKRFKREVTLVKKDQVDFVKNCDALVVIPKMNYFQKKKKGFITRGVTEIEFFFYSDPDNETYDFSVLIKGTGKPQLGETALSAQVERAVKNVTKKLEKKLDAIEGTFAAGPVQCNKRAYVERMKIDDDISKIQTDGYQELVLNTYILNAVNQAFGSHVTMVTREEMDQADECESLVITPMLLSYEMQQGVAKKDVIAQMEVHFFDGTHTNEIDFTLKVKASMKQGAEATMFDGLEKMFKELGDEFKKELKTSAYRKVGGYL
ncbi:MAG: hypothetical protein GF401_00940 [Chitinivibrionales bacterium]|nr:hypothetical protein [Chitinivibrionales bacterium]